VVRVGGRRSRSSSENREPSGVFNVATSSPGSAGSARRAAPATVACSRFSATLVSGLLYPCGADHPWQHPRLLPARP
jgi:hypothetical protein